MSSSISRLAASDGHTRMGFTSTLFWSTGSTKSQWLPTSTSNKFKSSILTLASFATTKTDCWTNSTSLAENRSLRLSRHLVVALSTKNSMTRWEGRYRKTSRNCAKCRTDSKTSATRKSRCEAWLTTRKKWKSACLSKSSARSFFPQSNYLGCIRRSKRLKLKRTNTITRRSKTTKCAISVCKRSRDMKLTCEF